MKLLIVDSLPDSEGQKVEGRGGLRDVNAFKRILAGARPNAELCVFSNTDGSDVPDADVLKDYAGLIWTGSPLSVNAISEQPVVRGRELMQAAIEAQVPCLGSCWGLQLASVVLGGKVEPARQGPQVKVEPRICLTAAGRAHPMMRDKPSSFQAVQVHNEEITRLPPEHARCLASSEAVEVEAAELVCGAWHFWGTQYHPELGLRELAAELDIEADALVEKKAYGSYSEISALTRELRSPASALRGACDYDHTVLDEQIRTLEIGNWLASITPRSGP